MSNLQKATKLVKEYLISAGNIMVEMEFDAIHGNTDPIGTTIEVAKMIQMADRWMPIREKTTEPEQSSHERYPGIDEVKIPADTKRLYVDAGCYNNGSKHQKAKIAITTEDELLFLLQVGNKTNNEAEFMAIEAAIQIIQKNISKEQQIVICSDSKIAVNMVTGEWSGKKPHLKKLASEVQETWGDWENIRVMWLPRRSNYAGIYLEFGNFEGKE